MGQALYRRYRPKTFSDVVGQEVITETLEKAIKSGRISHAYLFNGPRGVGKTSVARILAHEVNGIKYSDESIHLDIIEIDGASNRRIDEIRELRDKVHIAPTSSKYKVYIIDEVHMLTNEAFNALLKTLEEPPAHCIFILATTEAHKVPETIISRTQRFSFKPLGKSSSAKQIGVIAKQEKIDIEPEALELLAEQGGGSFRDSLSLLDQLSNLKTKITAEKVRQFIGLAPSEIIDQLEQAMLTANPRQVIEIYDKVRDLALNPLALAKQLARKVRQDLLEQKIKDSAWATSLLKDLLKVSESKQPAETLEIVLLDFSAKSSAAPTPISYSVEEKIDVSPTQPKAEPPKSEPIPEPERKTTTATKAKTDFNLDMWPDILAVAKEKYGSLYSILRLARPEIEGAKLILSFEFPLHYKKLNNQEYISKVESLIEQVTGSKLIIECQLDDKTDVAPKRVDDEIKLSSEPETTEQLQTISNIFGSAEVIES